MVEMAGLTDVGRKRSTNEDSIAMLPEMGLAVLADGMGGHNAGEVASGMAVAMISHELRPFFAARSGNALGETEVRQLLTGLAAKVNTAIYNTAQSQPRYFGMGTTLVIALWHGEQLTVAHLGDSRLYRLRGDRYEQLTRDHSWRQEQIDSGLVTPEQARTTGAKNIVTRACGIEPAVEPEVHTHPSQADDLYLLCSDGLSEMVADDAVRHLFTVAAGLSRGARASVIAAFALPKNEPPDGVAEGTACVARAGNSAPYCKARESETSSTGTPRAFNA